MYNRYLSGEELIPLDQEEWDRSQAQSRSANSHGNSASRPHPGSLGHSANPSSGSHSGTGQDLLQEPSSHGPQQQGQQAAGGSAQQKASPQPRRGDLMQEVSSGITQLLASLKKHFNLEKVDTGDILLVLIILFLYLEGDNLELVITLGLLLLFGLEDSPKEGS